MRPQDQLEVEVCLKTKANVDVWGSRCFQDVYAFQKGAATLLAMQEDDRTYILSVKLCPISKVVNVCLLV